MVAAEPLRKTGKVINVCGVKGRSSFACLVDGLPLTAGIDYTHCVLQGVYENVLENQVEKLSKTDEAVLKDQVEQIHAPKGAISHSRKIRGVNNIQFLKANETFNYLLYVGPVVFKDHTNADLNRHSMKSFLEVMLLLVVCDETDLQETEFVLDSFWHEIVDIFQNERIESFNLHILQQLVRQTGKFGPLFIFSAMSFESANRFLRSTATVTQSFCSLICRKVCSETKAARHIHREG